MNKEVNKTIIGIVLVFLLIVMCYLPTVLGSHYFEGFTRIPVLMYHDVLADTDDRASIYSLAVSAEKFEKDLVWLTENGYETVLPRDVAKGKPLPEKPVIITFDDGYESNYRLVFPLLKKYNLKGEINVIVSNIDDPAFSYFMDWDMLREMEASGLVEIGSHSYALHNPDTGGELKKSGRNGVQRLKGESREAFEMRVGADLARSLSRIEEELGTEVFTFSYPYGAKDLWSARTAESIFRVTMLTDPGFASAAEDCYNWKRFAVHEDTELAALLSL
jgi:biofilm PGA synthesis lipoprotein PgaB